MGLLSNLSRKALFTVVLLSIAVQSWLIFSLEIDSLHRGDGKDYYRIAQDLFSKKGFYLSNIPNVRRPPFYPLVMAVVFYFFGESVFAVQVMQVLLNIGTCLLVYFLACKIFGQKTAFISAVFTAVFPPLAGMSAHLISETTVGFLLTLAVYLLYVGIEKKSSLFFFIIGSTLALGTLTKPVMLFLPVVIIVIFFCFAHVKQALKMSLVMLIPFVLIVGTWTARNYYITGQFIPVVIGGELELWNGSYLPIKGDMEHPLAYQQREILRRKFDFSRPYYAEFKPFKDEALRNIKAHPWGYITLFPLKLVRLYIGSYSFILMVKSPFREMFTDTVSLRTHFGQLLIKISMWVSSLAILIFSLICIGQRIRCKNIVLPFLLIFVYWTAIHLIFAPIQRFSLPLLPVMIVFAVEGFFTQMKQMRICLFMDRDV